MPHPSYTLEVGEVMTRHKVEVFLARFGPDIKAARATAIQVERERPTAEEVECRVYTVAQLRALP